MSLKIEVRRAAGGTLTLAYDDIAAPSDAPPVLLIHGVLDALVNVEQSASMAKALQVSGNAARLVRIQNGDADLAAPQARLTLMRVVEAFLQKNLPPR